MRAVLRTVLPTAVMLLSALPAWAGDAAAKGPPGLALKRAMLSSAGVGYFEYQALVAGSATLGLDVPLDQVDDVLMSLVVFDSAGSVGTLDLPGRDDRDRTFGDVPFGPEALQSVADTLNSLQGVDISVQGPRPLTGRIVHAETVMEPMPGSGDRPVPTVRRTRVTLLSDDGLHQFVFEDVEGVQVTDPALRGHIDAALTALRRDTDKSLRHLTLHSTGNGPRTVNVGMVTAAPLWKTSYRLILPARPGDKARLQGWAVLENQSGTDWHDVALTLQYGNPVTFHQALYRSYYVTRPEVPVEILGRILPDIDTRATPPPAAATRFEAKFAPPATPAGLAAAPLTTTPPALAAPTEIPAAQEAPSETTFTVATPVSLAAGHSAVVPIMDREVSAERLDLVPRDSTRPLSVLRLTNDGTASLPAGVLTLYDPADGSGAAASFAGDSRLGGLPAGESRLLSFAEDLRTGIQRDAADSHNIVAVTAADGVLHVRTRQRHRFDVTITAPVAEARTLLVEFPRIDGAAFSVAGDPVAGTEATATAWRVPVAVAAGAICKLTAYSDEETSSDVTLLTATDDDPVLLALHDDQMLAPSVRAALDPIEALRRDEAAKRALAKSLDAEQQTVAQDEERIRKNLVVVAATDSLHGTLTRALEADETRIGQLRQALADAQAAAETAHRALADAVGALRL
ncbi:MAG: hypothetical protein P4M00_06845 [Azospirillaceae bacterium]|nr:hypothetical protein [Azospirillaceae bacterium]